MTGIGFCVLFSLGCLLFSCEGQVYPPSNQSMTFVLPGSTARLKWSFKNNSQATLFWYFTRRGSSVQETLAAKFGTGDPQVPAGSLPGVAIETTTLVLKNVDERYNGKYRFSVQIAGGSNQADVEIFILQKPNANVSYCSSPITVNEDNNVTCKCTEQVGNPQANVTWYKNGMQIGNTSYGENRLTLTSVTKQDIGTYTCKAQSYNLTDEKTIEVKVRLNFKPNKTAITFTKNPAVVGRNVAVMCESNGLPEPSYTIFHNDTKISNEKTYTIDVIQYNDTGTYQCIARNILGNDSASDNLAVGQIFLPPGGNSLTFLKKSTVRIKWSLDHILSTNINRTWSFKSSASGKDEILGEISRTGDITIVTRLYEVDIEKPATLVLKNVNGSYNGTYVFTLLSPGPSTSEVVVFIAEKPDVMTNCSSNITLDEGENRTCVCRGEGGNPPANVTWYKDGEQIGNASYGENILTLTNVTKQDNGTYKCVAQSYNLTDEEPIEVKVRLNYKPRNTTVTIKPQKKVKVGDSVTIVCKSDGLPEPKCTITHDDIVLTNEKTYRIRVVQLNDSGKYICNTWNKLGNDLGFDELTVEEGKDGDKDKDEDGDKDDDGLSSGAIIGIVIGVLVLAAIVTVVVWRYKSKEKDGYSGNANVSPGDSAGIPVNHYELNEEPDGGVDNAYHTVNPSEASGSKSKLPEENTPSSVYAAVDKGNKDGKPLYATLDSLALQSDNSKKKRDEERAGQTEYASIDFAKVGKVDEE